MQGERGTTRIKFNEWSERAMNPASQAGYQGKCPNQWATLPPYHVNNNGDEKRQNKPERARENSLD